MIARDLIEEISKISQKRNALLPVLHLVQEKLGYIPKEYIKEIANMLNLTEAEVYGVITFYHDFRTEPPGRHIIKVCRAESCIAAGCVQIQEYLKGKLGIDWGETTPDGFFSLIDIYCFGNCACSPSVMIDDKLYGRVGIEDLEKILEELRVRGVDNG